MNRIVTALCFVVFFVAQHAPAEEPIEVRIYRTQLSELHPKVKALAGKVERAIRDRADDRAKLDTMKELLALVKLNASLHKEALNADTRGMEGGKEPNKDLRLIAQASAVLGVVLDAVGNYLNTQDKAFLGIAKDSEKLLESIEQLLP